MNNEIASIPAYREVQQFRQLWIWAIVLTITVLMWYAFVQQLLLKVPFGENPMPDLLLIIVWILFGLGLPALIYYAKLVTEVHRDALHIRFVPFHRSPQRILLKDLKAYEVRTYRPLREYGGWGIRYGSKGKAYNVSGNRGLQLEFTNGKRLLIGSQRPEQLKQAIDANKATS